ncbi:MAG: helix-turn-helix domain-containing protein [Lachnospiraceae bacterium]|nr:helix-turn-helix domain-containing protein [Lachnospiraceae bacterium]
METTFGNRLKELRIKSGMTQKQLAERVGISKSIVSFYELHERQPSGDILIRLSATFHVSTDYLLGIDATPQLDLSGLEDEDIQAITVMVDLLRKKNLQ